MYSIKEAAALTDIPSATIRTWEKAYAIVSPRRTSAGHRRYSDDHLRLLAAMMDLVRLGWAPREAAQEVNRRTLDGLCVTDPQGDAPASAEQFGELISAAETLDRHSLMVAIDEGFARGPLEEVADQWLMPALYTLGQAWADGRVSIAGEHLASNLLRTRLAQEAAATWPERGAGSIMVGLPAGAVHELGALTFATLAQRAGIATLYVGSNLPAREWLTAARDTRARAVVIAVPRAHDLAEAARTCALLHANLPDLLVCVGGRYQHLVPPPAHALGHSLADAVDWLHSYLKERVLRDEILGDEPVANPHRRTHHATRPSSNHAHPRAIELESTGDQQRPTA